MDFHGVSWDYIFTKYKDESERGFMDNDLLVYLKETIVKMIMDCVNADLLDLLLKLLLEFGAHG